MKNNIHIDEIVSDTGKIEGIFSQKINIKEPFLRFAQKFSDRTGTILLLSGGNLDCSRYHILCVNPFLTFTGKGNRMTIKTDLTERTFEGDPFSTLRSLVQAYQLDNLDFPLPVLSGLFGYLSYDLKDHIEELPRTSVDDLSLPQIFFVVPSILVVHDKDTRETTLHIPERPSANNYSIEKTLSGFNDTCALSTYQMEGPNSTVGGFGSNFTQDKYMEAVETIREYIASGHVYQVNMTQRFTMDYKGNPFILFRDLYEKNPAPFFAFVNAGDHYIVSTSPERFIKQTGNDIESRPIKGTRPRGKTTEEDKTLKRELQNSKKDDAELSMIVDLIRNDIGKVCKSQSVHVEEHKRIEAYENVYHLISIVKGELEEPNDTIDLIKATFPGGSITGCPKIRSMEIIDELETCRRHIYTGSIGYVSFHRTMDFSIAIRTATIYQDRLYFSVGGGIVYDSKPLDEYEETLHKGKTLIETITGENTLPPHQNKVWMNGELVGQNDARIPVSDLGLQYGYGFFETIRVDNGDIKFLPEHVERLNETWKDLFLSDPPDLSWDVIIRQVIVSNNLLDKTAAIKILVTYGNTEKSPFHRNIIVSSRPYTHRLDAIKQKGVRLAVYPHPRQTNLADHKTLNYLYYYLAGKWADKNGANEALILNPDGTISETNTANIFIIRGNTVLIPDSKHFLQGVMQIQICALLNKWDYSIVKKQFAIEDLDVSDHILISNSLMGAVPVLSVDNKTFQPPSDLSKRINAEIL